jgi:alpha-ketoglutarate-dependent taurine dioxygenase
MGSAEWFHASPLHADKGSPILITPARTMDLLELIHAHRERLEEHLMAAGGILLRGFGINTVEKFDAVTAALSSSRPDFAEESSPRSQIQGAVYTSTDYPPEYPIQFHNEYAYTSRWPMRLFFCCFVAAETGGATPIADTRRILRRLRDETRARFVDKGLLYVRNFIPHVGVSWQKSFGTDDPKVVEAYLQQKGIEHRWGAEGRLQVLQRGPALAVHPKTGEQVWFNTALFFNVHGLEPESLREFFASEPEEDLSTHTYYGDGSPIAPEVIEELRQAYQAESSRFPWQVGDVLLIDNMLASHAREPYSGARRVAVVMADPYNRS